MKSHLLIFFSFVILLFEASCLSSENALHPLKRSTDHTLLQLVRSIKNTDVQFVRSSTGVICGIKGDAGSSTIKLLNLNDPRSIPLLREALKNDDQIIVAHVALTLLTQTKIPVSQSHWNTLPIHFTDYGVLSKEDKAMVIDYWTQRGTLRIARETCIIPVMRDTPQ